MRIYLDNCCFNRPFDDQSQSRIRVQAEAKLCVQEALVLKRVELAWCYILDLENSANPFDERRVAIEKWKTRAASDTMETPEIVQQAEALVAEFGLRAKDALHVACALGSGCEFFLTTDDRILRKLRDYAPIAVVDPAEFLRRTKL